jgi:acetyl-CoA carboxylase biotin carboxyl carrier protein
MGETPGLPIVLPAGLMRPSGNARDHCPMAELKVRSEIAGSVWKIEVAIGDAVAEDDPLIVLESMKMEIPLLSPRAGVVREILVAEGDAIGEGDIAVILA